VRETDALVDLYVDGEVISTTGEHPFWVPDFGWVEAKDLIVGSLLQTEDGRIVDVDRVEKREGKFEVYNFKVEDFHTYFVSCFAILVPNSDYNKIFTGYIRGSPAGMTDPHAHHILYKKGRGAAQQALAKEGQDILIKHGIDPIWEPENLTWVPNRVPGQHATKPLQDIVDQLKAVDAAGGGYDDIVKVIREHG